jgi:hypothetical protein
MRSLECGRALCTHPLHRSKRERKREREREREIYIYRICPELLLLFLKGMTGALASFSYLVANKWLNMKIHQVKKETCKLIA